MAPMPPLPRSASTTTSTTTLFTTLLRRIPTLPTLQSRQLGQGIIPTTYGQLNSGPAPGTVIGIVLGSVGGFLLILWLIYTCMQFGTVSSRSSYTESVIIQNRRKSHHGSSRSRRASETVEVRRAPSPVRIVREPSRVERVIVEESRETRRERERSRSLGGSDEVVVIEEHSPPRRKKSARVSSETERRDSGYRTVDPSNYGGAVGGRKSSSRR
ncbi:hypothetical protein VTL71DRAFT_8887 [Oculimacula yallundae]|uniref:Uncharacterized protein n=1 Tax=Oculimacula yallundae TaxID=86028 RepID=A0ABR4BT67_9HELO